MRGKHKKLQNISDKRGGASGNLVKTPSLLEQTSKIEQKLTHLKQKILQKKKLSVQDKKPALDETLAAFLARIALNQYVGVLLDNGIDSYEVLKDIKQAQLQEIGILKGHALKIVVHMRKEEEKSRKKSVNEVVKASLTAKERQETKPTLSQSSIQQKVVCNAVDSMQTESFPISSIKKSFCLYCFTRSEHNFCSSNCEQLYNGMFSKYQGNLQKAEESFIPKEGPRAEEELSDNQQFLENFDFLFNPQREGFDMQQYEQIKSIAKK